MENLDEQLGIDQMHVVQNQQVESREERPMFLTVLCILSFIGNGLGIMQGVIGLLMASIWGQMFKAIKRNGVNNIGKAQVEINQILNSITWFSLMFIIAAVLCLFGTILMWKLKKSGFILYVLGQCLPVLGTFFLFEFMFNGPAVGFGILISIFSAIFPICFVIMYGLNLKHLK